MPVARVEEMRAKEAEELRREMEEAYRELMNLRFRWQTHQGVNRAELWKARKRIARIQTVLREQELLRGGTKSPPRITEGPA
jgi:large subunit ribosomal protein L29